ncbi:MAG: hypothetical protein ACK4Z5_03780 [Brevundimonas sp.]
MRPLVLLLSMTAAAALAGAASAHAVRADAAQAPAASPRVTVAIGPELENRAEELGRRDIDELAEDLRRTVERELDRSGALAGAEVRLVLADAKPNRPTLQQAAGRPGLDIFRSISIGGAEIEGEVRLADGSVRPVSYDWYSNNLADVRGFSTWEDADRAFDRFARRLADGRF